MFKEDLALNNLQWLICHKNKPNQKNLFTQPLSREGCKKPNFYSEYSWFEFRPFLLLDWLALVQRETQTVSSGI